jgi:hypothetical protein
MKEGQEERKEEMATHPLPSSHAVDFLVRERDSVGEETTQGGRQP